MPDMADGIVCELHLTAREVDLFSRWLGQVFEESGYDPHGTAYRVLCEMRDEAECAHYMPTYVLRMLERLL